MASNRNKIYIVKFPYASNQTGYLKIGQTEYDGETRYDKVSKTYGMPYIILYETEAKYNDAEEYFEDHDVHNLLQDSSIPRECWLSERFNPNSEFFKISLQTAINAINAVKERRTYLFKDEIEDLVEIEEGDFVLRPEQRAAVDKTKSVFSYGNKMLWNCKMRFGKTSSALFLIRESGFKKVLVVSHRVEAKAAWKQDMKDIGLSSDYYFTQRDKNVKKYVDNDNPFICFNSYQYLDDKDISNDVFGVEWDLVIIDEAHEGNSTINALDVKKKIVGKNTKLLELSGTPYNIIEGYDNNQVFSWSYTDEQAAKEFWATNYIGRKNPYAALARLKIFTYDLSSMVGETLSDKCFSLNEFFRTNTETDEFIYKEKIDKFLDVISGSDDTTNFPFLSERYKVRHSMWSLQNVSSANALEQMLKTHKLFNEYIVINVAGENETTKKGAFEEVKKRIEKAESEGRRTITLTCGRLTVGVTIKEWTAILLLNGGNGDSSAIDYMQTIFRAQSPWVVNDVIKKEECYVYDFAPDRTLSTLAKTFGVATKSYEVDKDDSKEQLEKLLNFLEVISLDEGSMKKFDVDTLVSKIKEHEWKVVANSGLTHNYLFKPLEHMSEDIRDRLYGIDVKLTKSKTDSIIMSNSSLGQAVSLPSSSRNFPVHANNSLKKERFAREKLKEALKSFPRFIFAFSEKFTDLVSLDVFIDSFSDDIWDHEIIIDRETFREVKDFLDEDNFTYAIQSICKKIESVGEVKQDKDIKEYFKEHLEETLEQNVT